MKKFISFCMFFSILFFGINTTFPCSDMNSRIVGRVFSSIKWKNQKIEICVKPKINKSQKNIKFFGILFPSEFKASSSHSTSKLIGDNLIAFDYKQGETYCINLSPYQGRTVYQLNEKNDEVKNVLDKYKTLQKYFHKLNFQAQHKDNFSYVSRKFETKGTVKVYKEGVTIGSVFFEGYSGARGGCGEPDVKWPKKKNKVQEKTKARLENF